jgi:hypothetical protein
VFVNGDRIPEGLTSNAFLHNVCNCLWNCDMLSDGGGGGVELLNNAANIWDEWEIDL